MSRRYRKCDIAATSQRNIAYRSHLRCRGDIAFRLHLYEMLFHMMLNHVVEFGWRPKICLTNIQQCSCIRYTSFAMAPLNRQSLSIYTKDVTEVGSMSLEICLEFVVTTSHVRNEFHSWILHGDLNAMYLRCRKQVANVSPSDIEIMLQLCSTATFI